MAGSENIFQLIKKHIDWNGGRFMNRIHCDSNFGLFFFPLARKRVPLLAKIQPFDYLIVIKNNTNESHSTYTFNISWKRGLYAIGRTVSSNDNIYTKWNVQNARKILRGFPSVSSFPRVMAYGLWSFCVFVSYGLAE